ncbi:MAG: SUMF1/EgtB/PvdO family nonheme iron enzyme [Planctomycetota bacterium]
MIIRPIALITMALGLGCPAVLGVEPPDHTLKQFKNSVGMTMVRIPAGEFVMGCGKEAPRSHREFEKREWDEAPEHKVFISKEFYMSAFEVTNAEYEKFDPAHRKFRGDARVHRMNVHVSVADDEPVTFVSYEEALKFCAWLSKKEGKPYRLPTEAEWEYACRAGTDTAFSTGDALAPDQANLGGVAAKDSKASFTKPVGSYAPNAFGLYDMHGNVAEWCLDWYGPYTTAEKKDPVGRADGYSRVARGGSYQVYRHAKSLANPSTKFVRSSNRAGYLPFDANRELGFRVVQAPVPKTKPLPEFKPLCTRDVKQDRPKPHERHKEPYFHDFAKAGKNPPQKSHWGPFFHHCHYTNIIACPNGDMLAFWDSIHNEYTKDATGAASRLPYGSDTWQPVSELFKVPDVNFLAGSVLSDGESIYLFAPAALIGFRDASLVMTESRDSGATWSKPRLIYPRTGDEKVSRWFLQEILTTALGPKGELMFESELYQGNWGFFVSKDKGKTWKVNGVARGGGSCHASLHIAKSGKWTAYTRAGSRTAMPRWESSDEGKTWTKAAPTPFPPAGIGNKLKVLTLKSGATLLVTADRFKPTLSGGKFGCALVALSDDDGHTWPHVRSLPFGGGLSAAQNLDGLVYVFGGRRNVVAFNEAWVRQGKSAEELTAAREAKLKSEPAAK